MAGLLVPIALAWGVPRLELGLYDTRLWAESYGWGISRDLLIHRSIVLLGKYETSRLRSTDARQWTDSATAQVVRELIGRGASGALLCLDQIDVEPGDPFQALPSPLVLLASSSQREGTPNGFVPDGAVRDTTDGSYRREYIAENHPPRPSGALLLYARYLGVDPAAIRYLPDRVEVGSRTIHSHSDARGWPVWVRLYRINDKTFESNSMTLTTDGQIEPVPIQGLSSPDSPLYNLANGKFFFYGDYDIQATGERLTPLGKYRDFQYQGVVLDTLIRGWDLRAPNTAEIIVLALSWNALCTLILLTRVRMIYVALNALVLGTLCATVNCFLFHEGWLLPLSFPLVDLATVTLLASLSLWTRSLDFVRRFGGQATADAIATGRIDAVELEVDEREATILFTNLPDYLKRLENTESDHLFERRGSYSDTVTRIIARNGGLVHDFQADYLMFGFGTEIGQRDPEHALHALTAAIELIDAVAELARSWAEEAEPEEVDVSCGLCTGLVAVGFVGAKKYKRAPAAIGDTTNVAARLLVASRKLKVRILLHERTQQLLPPSFKTKALPPVELKGKSKPVPIFELIS